MDDLKNDPGDSDARNAECAATAVQPRAWSRLDRIRLALWALLALLVPVAIVLCVFKRRICFRGYWLFSLARRMRFWRQFLRGSSRQPW